MSKGARLKARHADERRATASRREPKGAYTTREIAHAVMQATASVMGNTDRKCSVLAGAGALVADAVLPGQWLPQGGRVRIWTGDLNSDGEAILELGGPGTAPGDYHAWFGRMPEGLTGGKVMKAVTMDPARLIAADLSLSQFDRQRAALLGFEWNRAPLPEYFWGTIAEAAEKHRIEYRAMRDETEHVYELLREGKDVVMEVVHRATMVLKGVKLFSAA
jgi:hypothetical protein